tara:strand:+ start:955 stop:2211 length:1257 start_codon:yes stop_codon:yes gene_type:complete
MNDFGAAYLANHRFAVAFTCVAAASQGLGGLLAVLGMGDYGESVAHLMSFSTGVMVYLSFMDIMVDTTEKIGETYSSIAFFVGFGLFLLLEIALPEVEGEQVVELFGLGWSPSSPSTKAEQTPKASSEDEVRLGLRQRAGRASDDAPPEPPPSAARRAGSSPARARAAPASPPKSATVASRKRAQAVPSSPPPSQKREAFKEEGEQALTDRRKRRVAFSGLMVMISISLHNIPEGVAVYLTCLKGVESGLPLAIAMSLHNIPEGMAVAGPLYAATKSKTKAVLAATISGGFEVLGCLLVQLFFERITPFFLESMLSLVAGIMVGLGALLCRRHAPAAHIPALGTARLTPPALTRSTDRASAELPRDPQARPDGLLVRGRDGLHVHLEVALQPAHRGPQMNSIRLLRLPPVLAALDVFV